MSEAAPSYEPIERRALLRDAIRTSSLLGALVCTIVALLGWPSLALGIAIGTLLGGINFVLLARGVAVAIDRTVASVERTRRELDADTDRALEPGEVVDRPLGAGGMFRFALALALVAALLWLLPTDPAGLAIGIVITLIGASVAAHRLNHNRAKRAS